MFSFPLSFAGLIIAQLKVIMMNKPNYLELDSPSLIPTECNHIRYTLVVCVSVNFEQARYVCCKFGTGINCFP